jgi:hypothetical protein
MAVWLTDRANDRPTARAINGPATGSCESAAYDAVCLRSSSSSETRFTHRPARSTRVRAGNYQSGSFYLESASACGRP